MRDKEEKALHEIRDRGLEFIDDIENLAKDKDIDFIILTFSIVSLYKALHLHRPELVEKMDCLVGVEYKEKKK